MHVLLARPDKTGTRLVQSSRTCSLSRSPLSGRVLFFFSSSPRHGQSKAHVRQVGSSRPGGRRPLTKHPLLLPDLVASAASRGRHVGGCYHPFVYVSIWTESDLFAFSDGKSGQVCAGSWLDCSSLLTSSSNCPRSTLGFGICGSHCSVCCPSTLLTLLQTYSR